jgi:hypothetical protein
MKLLFFLILIGGGAYFFPMFKESTANQCDAVEKLAIRLGGERGIPANLLQAFSGGKLADLLVRGQYPNLPPSVACAFVYWKAALDPNSLAPASLKPTIR